MHKKSIESQTHLDKYFARAREVKCPSSMKQNLYQQLATKKTPWFTARYTLAGLSLVLVTAVTFKISNNQPIAQDNIIQAEADLQLAMHYMNRVSFKSLSSVNNKGIKPGLIMPMAKSVVSL